ncbi:MAG: glycosyltransferase [Ignavibacteriales bacterium]|nr:glycosyltransferase [Ignavibacteriales bacterium]
MTVLTTLLLAATAAYVGHSLLMLIGLARARFRDNTTYEPTVSIVVAARNEEKNVQECLESLVQLEYPKNKFEIIIVDDNSTDATPSLIAPFVASHSNVRSFVAHPAGGHLRGKANAIAQGIDIASGDIIMMTDADCAVRPSWIRGTVQQYEDTTGIVAGLTLLKYGNWFGGMQSLDWAYVLALASSTMAMGNPLSCIGNNFTFRRKAYDEVGGYRNIKFSVTEDFALFTAITQSGRWGYRYPIRKETLVLSKPCTDSSSLYRQKRRWGVGGKDMSLSGFAIGAVGFLLHALYLLSPFLGMDLVVVGASFGVKLLCDYCVLRVPLRRTDRMAEMQYLFHFEIYFILYIVLLPFAVFLGGAVVWKGRRY